MTTTYTPATDKQVAFLTKLSIERGVASAEDIAKLVASGLDKQTASRMIDALMKTRPTTATTAKPQAPAMPDVPAGHYALVNGNDGKVYFFKVDRPTEGRWAGRIFISQLSGDNHIRMEREEQRQVLAAIADDPLDAMKRYGRETKVCGKCHKRLTDQESRALGIGPRCLKTLGGLVELNEEREWDRQIQDREAEQERAAYMAKWDAEERLITRV